MTSLDLSPKFCFLVFVLCNPTDVWGAVGEVKEILGGGDPVVEGDFLWLVGLLDVSLGDEVRKLVCGGSILSPSHVLTAGRCVTRWVTENNTHEVVPPRSLRIVAGDINRMEDEPLEQFRPVRHVILHPGFRFDAGYKSQVLEAGKRKGFVNDLAILEVEPPFNISADGGGVSPIALGGSTFYSTLTSSNAVGELSVAGWGITDKRQNTIPTGISLKKVTLPFTPVKVVQEKKDKSQKASNFGLSFDPSAAAVQFSSGLGSDRGLMGRCMGDPGSGVVAHGPQGPLLVGIVSFGIWCDRYLPTGQVFLLSPLQLDWVEGVVNPKFWAFLSLGVIFLLLLLSAGGLVLVRRRRGGIRSWRV